MNKEMLSNKISLLCFLKLTDFLSRFADMGFVCLTAEKKSKQLLENMVVLYEEPK